MKFATIAASLSLVLISTPALSNEISSADSSRTACSAPSNAGGSGALAVVGLTADMQIICFKEKRPDDARSSGVVTGLTMGDKLVGIDYRVQDGKLYGVSRTGGIYVLDVPTAVATKVSQLSVGLEGTSFGVDFNPAADRLRIVSDTGQNLRHNVNSGGVTLVDDPLDYPPASPLNGTGPAATFVSGSAYTNNDLVPATATTLYALDTLQDQVALQSPPNDGTLAATGKLGIDAGAEVGFDIYSTVRSGVTVEVRALASILTPDGRNGLYTVDLPTGKATLRGSFSSHYKVIGIAIPLDQLR